MKESREDNIESVVDLWMGDFLKNPDAITSFVASYLDAIKYYSQKAVKDILRIDITTLDTPDAKAIMLHPGYAHSKALQKKVRKFYRYLCIGSN